MTGSNRAIIITIVVADKYTAPSWQVPRFHLYSGEVAKGFSRFLYWE